jgi:hypothetical protein
VTKDTSGDDDSSVDPAETGVEAVIRAFHQPDEPETASFASELIIESMMASAIDPGEKPEPSPVTDAEPVLRDQLTENTGRHPMDSGGIYGRSWSENRENPPWERPAWDVSRDYVAHNVYDYMVHRLERDDLCVALETALYAFGRSGDRDRESWLRSMEDFAKATVEGQHYLTELLDIGVPREAAEMVIGYAANVPDNKPHMAHNTYNLEDHTLSQDIQFVTLGGPYAEYVLVQIHGGSDIRGGYTAPRVYRTRETILPHELHYRCTECDWSGEESCLWDSDELLYQRTVDHRELEEETRARAPDEARVDDVSIRTVEAADHAENADHTDGAVFHVGDGCGGYVRFH